MGVRAGHKRSLNVSLDFADPQPAARTATRRSTCSTRTRTRRFLHTVLYFAHRPAVHPGAEGELREGRHQRRELGPVRQRPAVRQGRSSPRTTRPARGPAGRSAATPAADGGLEIPRRERRGLQAALSRSSRATTRRTGRPSIALCKMLNETPPDKLEEALEADPRHRRRALVPGAGQRPDQRRRLLDPRQRLQHLPRRRRASSTSSPTTRTRPSAPR